jgi:hypothetical protein
VAVQVFVLAAVDWGAAIKDKRSAEPAIEIKVIFFIVQCCDINIEKC